MRGIALKRIEEGDPKPALIIEIKWDKGAGEAIRQIKDKHYVDALTEFKGNILLVGINYNKKDQKHECVIERTEI